jgi:aminoglycoside phosphotransferase (APT) family kinase protein
MYYDDLAWERSDTRFDIWKRNKLFKRENLRAIGNLIDKWSGGVPDTLMTPGSGAFNVWIRLKFVDGGSAVMRVPRHGRSIFPEEKIQREVAVMRFLQYHTNIPVPHILHYGMTEESPDDLGPFIIMEYIEHEYDLVDALNTPGHTRSRTPDLEPSDLRRPA